MVLLELVTGQKPLEESNAEDGFKGKLVDWVNQLSSSGRIKDAISRGLCGKGYDEEILKLTENCMQLCGFLARGQVVDVPGLSRIKEYVQGP